MLSIMRAARVDLKVLWTVVLLVAVAVMDDLIGGERPTELLLHNSPVFHHVTSIDKHHDIAVGVNDPPVPLLNGRIHVSAYPRPIVMGNAVTHGVQPSGACRVLTSSFLIWAEPPSLIAFSHRHKDIETPLTHRVALKDLCDREHRVITPTAVAA